MPVQSTARSLIAFADTLGNIEALDGARVELADALVGTFVVDPSQIACKALRDVGAMDNVKETQITRIQRSLMRSNTYAAERAVTISIPAGEALTAIEAIAAGGPPNNITALICSVDIEFLSGFGHTAAVITLIARLAEKESQTSTLLDTLARDGSVVTDAGNKGRSDLEDALAKFHSWLTQLRSWPVNVYRSGKVPCNLPRQCHPDLLCQPLWENTQGPGSAAASQSPAIQHPSQTVCSAPSKSRTIPSSLKLSSQEWSRARSSF